MVGNRQNERQKSPQNEAGSGLKILGGFLGNCYKNFLRFGKKVNQKNLLAKIMTYRGWRCANRAIGGGGPKVAESGIEIIQKRIALLMKN